MEQLRERAIEIDAAAQARIEDTEAQFKSRLMDYEASHEADNEKTESQQQKLNEILEQLEAERHKTADERDRARMENGIGIEQSRISPLSFADPDRALHAGHFDTDPRSGFVTFGGPLLLPGC